MSQMKKTALALAASASLALLAAQPAHAYVMASSMVNMSNFLIKKADGSTMGVGDFDFLTFTTSADYAIDLTGYGNFGDAGFSSTSSIDFAPACLGAACNPILPDNSFPKLFAPPVTGNYVAADQLETGTPITGLVGFGGLGAQVANGSYTGLDVGTVAASADSNNNLNASFIFKLNQAGGVSFSFDVDAFLQVAVSAFPDERFPAFATASYQMDFSVTNLSAGGVTVWSYAPDLFGDGTKTLSLNAPLPVNAQVVRNTCFDGVNIPTLFNASVCSKSFSGTTVALNNTDLYQLSARIQTNVDAQRVSEPGMLGLLGLGLVGLGLARRMRRQA